MPKFRTTKFFFKNSKEQLDIYLDCLEDNELEKFSCFKVIYKVLPKLKNEKNVSKLEKVHA